MNLMQPRKKPPSCWNEQEETVCIPPGRYFIGAEPKYEPYHPSLSTQSYLSYTRALGPHREVEITKPYLIGKKPISIELWNHVVSTSGMDNALLQTLTDPPVPAHTIRFENAVRFCNSLSMKCGLTPVYGIKNSSIKWTTRKKNVNGYRLPTEAEWEIACRAGTDTPIPTGLWDEINLSRIAWHRNNSGVVLRHSGQTEPNAWGLSDMLGSVKEWCWDKGATPAPDPDDPPQVDPRGETSRGQERVTKGGSFDQTPAQICSSRRDMASTANWSSAQPIGFRIVRNLE